LLDIVFKIFINFVLRYQLRGCLHLVCSSSPYWRCSSFVASEDRYFVHAEIIIPLPLRSASSSPSVHELLLPRRSSRHRARRPRIRRPRRSPSTRRTDPATPHRAGPLPGRRELCCTAPLGTSTGTTRAPPPCVAWDLRRGAASSAATRRSRPLPGRHELRRPVPLRTVGTPLPASSLSSSPGVVHRCVGHACAAGPLEGNREGLRAASTRYRYRARREF
jgi:hypothetical protein